MAKNPNRKTKPVKQDDALTPAMKFFLAGCVAELYLLIVRRYYISGSIKQVIAWDSYLVIFTWISAQTNIKPSANRGVSRYPNHA